MATNPYPNKVEKADGTVLLDISDTSAIASDVLLGKEFYLATGEKVHGQLAIVQGSFTSKSSSGVVTVDIPYDGDGYPIAFIICLDGGSTSDSTAKRYAIVSAYGVKRITDNPMTYDGTAANDGFSVQCVQKGSSATSYTTGGSAAVTIGHQTDPSASTSLFVSITAKNVFKFYTMASSYGLYPDKEYNYLILYSS